MSDHALKEGATRGRLGGLGKRDGLRGLVKLRLSHLGQVGEVEYAQVELSSEWLDRQHENLFHFTSTSAAPLGKYQIWWVRGPGRGAPRFFFARGLSGFLGKFRDS